MATNSKPKILLVSLEHVPWFDDMYGNLIDELHNKTHIQRVKTADAATRKLSEGDKPAAIIITDAALASEPANAHVWEKILEYVRQGGTAVVAGVFSSFVRPDSMEPFFSKAGLSWERGSYHRTTTYLHSSAARMILSQEAVDRLPRSYSQKALSVSKVARGDVWYASSSESVIESHVFAPDSAFTPGEAAVALASVGQGKLGFMGDVNAEQESTIVLLGLCGLL